MDLHLDTLLNLPYITVQNCTQEDGKAFLKLRFLNSSCACPHCHNHSDQLHQTRFMFIRDLSILGKAVYLEVPRRQFYCTHCQRYFTEELSFADWGRGYTRRYEEYIYEQVQQTNIEQVRRNEGLSWDQVKGIFDHQFSKKKLTGVR